MYTTRPIIAFVFSLLVTMFSLPSHAADVTNGKSANPFGSLQSYEPNLLGYAHDSNDVGYMDFKISLKYPMFHSGLPEPAVRGWLPHPYLAFTGRFAQYIGTRHSSPVISKRFNPELFGRYWLSNGSREDRDHIDIAYGHESNGQSIDTAAAYQARRDSFIATGENPDYANDYISRGWDYLGATWKFTRNVPFTTNTVFSGYLQLRYFLEDGLLQGKQEEYNTWENNPEAKRRKSVDGIRLKLKFNTNFANNTVIKDNKIFLSFTTGYADTFDYNTFRAEWAVAIKNVPFMLWYQSGYNSDLVDYYKDVTSFGIAMEFVSN